MINSINSSVGQPRAICACDTCGREEVIPCANDERQAVEKLSRISWGASAGKLRCHMCEAKRKAATAEKPAAQAPRPAIEGLHAVYAPSGQEFDAQEEAEALGVWCAVPRRVDLIRSGNRRFPDAVVSPYLQNYVFAQATSEEWHWLRQSKLCRSLIFIPPASSRSVMAFIDRVEADFADRMAQIEAGHRVSEYDPGDLLEIIAGPLAGQFAQFRSIAEGAGMFPEIRADGPLGAMRLDPLHVRKAV